MKRIVESVYYKSPVLLQNCAVSLMGLRLRRERYTAEGDAMLDVLRKSQHYSQDAMLAYQSKEFVHLARHAINTTDFYRKWSKDAGVNPEDIESLDDIKLFPVIQKETVRENPEQFRSKAQEGSPTTLFTSGTTGTPLKVFTDNVSRSRHYAFFSRLREGYGVMPVDRRVTMFGRIIMLGDQKQPPFWRYDAAQKNLLMSSYHLKEENLHHYYQKICDFKPVEIFSYPSSLTAIAEFVVKNKLKPIKLKLAMTTAEKLLDPQRKIIEEAFDAPLVNQYGCTEMAFFAASDKTKKMHFHPEHGIVEVLDSAGVVSCRGEGELLATGLVNFSMPIIRYATGDDIVLGEKNANGFVSIESLSGRVDDTIYSKDGTPVGRLDPVFKGGSGIKLAQIEQMPSGDVVVRVVPDESYDEHKSESIKLELLKRLGSGLDVNIIVCQSIAKERNGKFRPVVSHYGKGRDS